MVNTIYRILPGENGDYDVQMVRPTGQSQTATGFGSEHEAAAWIVQAQRMRREATPWATVVPRKAGSTLPPTGLAGGHPLLPEAGKS